LGPFTETFCFGRVYGEFVSFNIEAEVSDVSLFELAFGGAKKVRLTGKEV
jgi:hypothetical protein